MSARLVAAIKTARSVTIQCIIADIRVIAIREPVGDSLARFNALEGIREDLAGS
jgi:hypothetical protein